MKFTDLKISNFRILGDVSFDAGDVATVIVGPNASGKTTVLEAVRFLMAILAPRTPEDFQSVAQAMSIYDPAAPFSGASLLGDPTQPGQISMGFELTPQEQETIRVGAAGIALTRLSRVFGPQGHAAVTQHLSTVEGRTQLAAQTELVGAEIDALTSHGGVVRLDLTIEINGVVRGQNAFAQECIGYLSRILPYSLALVSYFPADRAMATGQVSLQLGAAEVQTQLRSHLGQPQQKYLRLKQYVVTQRIFGQDIENHFNDIFNELLPGKALGRFHAADNGQLTIEIVEPATGRRYDIDQMSSGEKGIVLTFLLIRRTVAAGGLILLDEPELHLNPAICRKLLPYLVDKVLAPLNIQAIICTHSPEILAEAYRREETTLLHLRSPRDLTAIHRRDKDELFEAIHRLGSDPAATLFNQGVLFVEGPDDVMLVEAGFQNDIEGFKLQRLGGRSELEINAKRLKTAEQDRQLSVPQSFILDNDRKPVEIESTAMVRIVQLDRYCIENYLLDPDVVFDVVKQLSGGKQISGGSKSRGEIKGLIRGLAMGQLPYEIARLAYTEPDNPGLRPSEIRPLGDQYQDIGALLACRLSSIVTQIGVMDRDLYAEKFAHRCRELEEQERPKWEHGWEVLVDGKRLLRELRNTLGLPVSESDLKRRLMQEASREQCDSWSKLRGFVVQAVTGVLK